ncbi:hypothetical protein ACIG0C_20505 [Kitasatospora aureofaciens]|uniref:Uncharacterized protein n=1 Tax=Kitasatospora aureofaciens TaxID=1894 RepID=A0A1E7MY61_KITAU|nr:hypothetical protein [Kitasatospora aureofaciens]QEV01722.1 hypothetical protein CP971_22990 [Streptomyces viridifaciens]ARF80479.1 hypothetical protein B6264_17580 [Kitasatospora aureofaciens]OEV33377.1 hypothetical protein HS99_0012355 [Kitasatospora aureofaciens]UKZ08158.1 hypothetical protein BOQ63_029885 [Streptomyces viridifaciens]GGU59418.1 hypothetical protein GCM10010502_07200 [Kitasatospora aureofaciens]
MGFVLVFLVALVATVVGTTLFLVRRERARRHWAGEIEGLSVEQHRTAQAAQMRSTYTSVAVHNGHGLFTDDLHKHHP